MRLAMELLAAIRKQPDDKVLAALDELLPRWISVEEKWPRYLSDVLVAYKCGNYVRLGVGEFDGTTVNDEGITIPYFKGIGGFEVTHWMPLPAQPTDAKWPANTQDQQPRTKEAANMSDTNERSVASAGSGSFMDLPMTLLSREWDGEWSRLTMRSGTIRDILDDWDIDDEQDQSEVCQLLRHLRRIMGG